LLDFSLKVRWNISSDHHLAVCNLLGKSYGPFFPEAFFAVPLLPEEAFQGRPELLQPAFRKRSGILVVAQVETMLRAVARTSQLPTQVTPVLSRTVKRRHWSFFNPQVRIFIR
jgi:hypothetical protein